MRWNRPEAPEGMGFPPRLALATRNPGKVREILRICAAWPVAWVLYADASPEDRARWPEVEEHGATYLENALLKAREVALALDVPALADDSGIEADALGGVPGPRSARFASEGATDEENLALLLRRVTEAAAPPWTASYLCVASCAWPDGTAIWREATCEGRLIDGPRGTGGFGYDPAFVPTQDSSGRTMAELDPEEKDRISHRGKAFRALREALAEVAVDAEGGDG
jgi:XTP/dITP diphosphohydrolase